MSEKNFKSGPHAAKNKPATAAEIDAKVSAVDERKTVVLDEDLSGVEFEDKVWLYWKRNKNFIVCTVALAFAIILGGQGWKMYSKSRATSVAAAYQSATDAQKRADFANAYAGSPLAGVALIENADALYRAGDFAKALPLYKDAAKSLSGTPFLGRALLGEAASVLASGKKDDAKKALDAVYKNAKIQPAYRAQAGYILALVLKQDGKAAESDKLMKEIADNPESGVFANIAADAVAR